MKSKILYLIFIIVFILHIINQTMFSLSVLIFVPLYFIAFCLTTKHNILGVYLALIMISSSSLLYLTNVFFVLLFILLYRNELPKNKVNILILILILMESMHVLLNAFLGYEDHIFKLLGFCICFIPLFFIRQIEKNIDVKVSFNFLLMGFIMYSIITIMTYSVHFNLLNFFDDIRRFGYIYGFEDRFMIIENPNTVGKHSAFIIACYITLLRFNIIKFNKTIFLLIVFTGIVGALTLSRTFVLLIFIITLLIISSFLVEVKLTKFFVSIFSISFIAVIFKLGFNNLYLSIMKRFSEVDDISGGRLEIFQQYIDYILTHTGTLIYGVGLQDYLGKIQNYNDAISQSAHNVLIEIIISWGLIGLILIVFYLLLYIFNSYNFIKSNASDKIFRLLPFTILAIAAMLSQFFASYYHTIGITLFSLVILNIRKKEYENSDSIKVIK